MRTRATAQVAWALSLLASFLSGCTLYLMVLNRANPAAIHNPYWLADTIIHVAFPVVGALIITRYPGHTLGWLFWITGVSLATTSFASEYAKYALLTEPGVLPGGLLLAWVASFVDPFLLFVAAIPLLFPDGRLPSRRWRPVAWSLACLFVLGFVVASFRPGPMRYFPSHTNPFGITLAAAAVQLFEMAAPLFVVLLLLCAIAPVVRFRRARGEERQQLKWFSFAAVSVPVSFIGNGLFPDLAWLIGGLSLAFLIGAIGLAVLRYQLWNIDLIINQTLVYGVLTAMLALVYFGTVLVLQQLFRPLMGAENDLAIVASTLAIAALFQPLRRHIQAFIDRRFYRRRYDAARTLQAFSQRLRDEVDLNTLTEDLLRVVEETLQPTHASLWLRKHTPSVPNRQVETGRSQAFELTVLAHADGRRLP